MEEILKFYTAILSIAGMKVESDGSIAITNMGSSTPALINGKRLVLPTTVQLRSVDNDTKVFFHPLVEDIRYAESEVIQFLKRVISIGINYRLGTLIMSIMHLLENVENHKLLNRDQSEFLYKIKDLDKNSSVNFTKMFTNAIKKNPEEAFISMFFKRKLVLHETSFARGTITTFPILRELAENVDLPYGTKIRKKDILTFTTMFELAYPDIHIENMYTRGSNSKVAPFLDSLIKTVIVVLEPLNNLVDLFADKIDDTDMIRVDYEPLLEMITDLNKYSNLIRSIPPQAGNEGVMPINDQVASNKPALPAVNNDAYTKSVVSNPVPPTSVYQQPASVPVASVNAALPPGVPLGINNVPTTPQSTLDLFRSKYVAPQQQHMQQQPQQRTPTWAQAGYANQPQQNNWQQPQQNNWQQPQQNNWQQNQLQLPSPQQNNIPFDGPYVKL